MNEYDIMYLNIENEVANAARPSLQIGLMCVVSI